MKQTSVFMLRLQGGEFRIVPFMMVPKENITTPIEAYRKPIKQTKRRKLKK